MRVYIRFGLVVLALVLMGLVVILSAWYLPRRAKLHYFEEQGHFFFSQGEMDSAIYYYEKAMAYGSLDKVGDVMYRMTQAFRSDQELKNEYFELADSTGRKVNKKKAN